MKLYDPELRSAENYGVAIFWAVTIARLFASVRLLCAAVFTGCVLAGDLSEGRWLWLGAALVAVTGSSLAWLAPREDVLHAMRSSAFSVVQLVGRYLLFVARRATVSLPGFLEGLGPLLMAAALGVPSSPLASRDDAYTVAVVVTAGYAVTAVFQWMADGSYYLPGRGGVPPKLAVLLRGAVPGAVAVLALLLLTWGLSAGPTVVVWLASVSLLLVYPAVFLFDDMMRAAQTHRADHTDGELMKAACTVHAYLSTPVHFIEMEARHGTAERVVGQLQDLRTRVRQCRMELVDGASSGRVDELLDDIASFLPPGSRHLVTLSADSDVAELGRIDFAMARRVLTDLCGNALKSAADGRVGASARVRVRWETTAGEPAGAAVGDRRVVAVLVVDDGAGMRQDIQAGSSLELLRTTLELAGGELTVGPAEGGGTRAHARWPAQTEEIEA
ncbi:HAMP domain-containing histidine kinase [Micromonospora sp. KC207]|uniref:HAMP domain-containing histidine kinase n=1 Tax=Micromonospora sp. KC207 TaxID=2530377 RepID=UPI0010480CB9|nr:HAMP domain-containing histidine kinase [Micromonospora sp. KC207]TDC64735.1 HAMP domain-containing histidine kinase [Micromonospora sp. KC207]